MEEILAKIKRAGVEVTIAKGMSRELLLTDFIRILQSRIEGTDSGLGEKTTLLPAGTLCIRRKDTAMSVFMYFPETTRIFRLRDKHDNDVVHEWTIPVPNIVLQVSLSQEPDQSWCLRSKEDVHMVCTNAPAKVIRNWINSGWSRVTARQPASMAQTMWRVFPVPFGNVFRGLDICWGNAYKQTTGFREEDLSALEDWYDAYFNSIGNHDLDILGVIPGTPLGRKLRVERSPHYEGSEDDDEDRDDDGISFYAYFEALSEHDVFPYDQYAFSPN